MTDTIKSIGRGEKKLYSFFPGFKNFCFLHKITNLKKETGHKYISYLI